MSSLNNLLNPESSSELSLRLQAVHSPSSSNTSPTEKPVEGITAVEIRPPPRAEVIIRAHEPHPDCPDTLACLPDTDGRPQHTLPVILRCTILGSPRKRLTIREIYAAMERKYPYYKTAGPAWKQSVRHHLSLNRLFERQPRPPSDPGFGSYWTVNLDAPPGTKRPRKRGGRSTKADGLETGTMTVLGPSPPPPIHTGPRTLPALPGPPAPARPPLLTSQPQPPPSAAPSSASTIATAPSNTPSTSSTATSTSPPHHPHVPPPSHLHPHPPPHAHSQPPGLGHHPPPSGLAKPPSHGHPQPSPHPHPQASAHLNSHMHPQSLPSPHSHPLQSPQSSTHPHVQQSPYAHPQPHVPPPPPLPLSNSSHPHSHPHPQGHPHPHPQHSPNANGHPPSSMSTIAKLRPVDSRSFSHGSAMRTRAVYDDDDDDEEMDWEEEGAGGRYTDDDYSSSEDMPYQYDPRHHSHGSTSYAGPSHRSYSGSQAQPGRSVLHGAFSSYSGGDHPDPTIDRLKKEMAGLRRQSQDAVNASLRLSDELRASQEEATRAKAALKLAENMREEEVRRRIQAEQSLEEEMRRRRTAEESLRQYQAQRKSAGYAARS
ncbi:hypothetical protein C8Q79DRAFT_937353 [Trametes meyenii]|nr:hypothetical protein C8Q79DRAFT_937353 [Trametes meyenii]